MEPDQIDLPSGSPPSDSVSSLGSRLDALESRLGMALEQMETLANLFQTALDAQGKAEEARAERTREQAAGIDETLVRVRATTDVLESLAAQHDSQIEKLTTVTAALVKVQNNLIELQAGYTEPEG